MKYLLKWRMYVAGLALTSPDNGDAEEYPIVEQAMRMLRQRDAEHGMPIEYWMVPAP